jgi:hypothetical protein
MGEKPDAFAIPMRFSQNQNHLRSSSNARNARNWFGGWMNTNTLLGQYVYEKGAGPVILSGGIDGLVVFVPLDVLDIHVKEIR